MHTIANTAIEPGERSFVIDFVLFGTVTRPATRRKVTVLARTREGAQRIVKAQWPRSSEHKILEESEIIGQFRLRSL